MSLIGNEDAPTETTQENTTEETATQTTSESSETQTAEDGVTTTEPTVKFPEGVDEEITKDPSLQVFIKDGEINYANMMKSYVHAQRQMGADKVVIPGKNASDEDWNNFYNKVGRPELDKYEVKPVLQEGQEADTDMINAYKQAAHAAGILPRQAQALMNWFGEHSNGVQQTMADRNQEAYDKQLETLKSDWGEAYERELKLSDRALKEFATPEEVQYLVDSGIADDVNVVRLFNKIGKGLAEDTFDQESHGSFGMTKAQAEAKINEYLSDEEGAYRNPAHANHKNAVLEVNRLHEILAE